MSLNILVIDDQVKTASRLMDVLKSCDTENRIGEIIVDDSILRIENIEKYDVATFGIKFDAVLIDYQLFSDFTGSLVSAWIALHINVPRLTLTSAPYPDNPKYFNGFIQKKEITDNPCGVLKKIIHCIETFDSKAWLEKQYSELISSYQQTINNESNIDLSVLESVLDKFERVLDSDQEKKMKEKMIYLDSIDEFKKKEKKNNDEFEQLKKQLDMYLKDIEKNEE